MPPIAVAVPILWLAWLVLTEWVPTHPLNDLAPGNLRPRLLAAAINYPFPLLIAAGVAPHRPWSSIAAPALCVQRLVVGLLALAMSGTTLAATLSA
ncbi:hypothetical protein L3Q65_06460 [Amycolatopsis sp. FU40]|uniref:hypothetical protein n=1 Tax=Amycolatopsis sp. FU40 TaxID=2914159 RepID=UPI001F24D358|nr:hypothetical protein [Amycolatopsis sp. FU40]UKD56357.1 hypothetical protein L3Q65_06460 [Amycolatopsis sp. FU40]